MENELIERYKVKRAELEQVEHEMNDHFETVVDSMLEKARTPSDFDEIKERYVSCRTQLKKFYCSEESY